jgi:hypothetical protein
MPYPAEFSERQYELAVNLELLCGGAGEYLVPTQRAEKIGGFDIALVPALKAIWSHLGAEPEPRAGGRRPPPFAASLFIQYKRPEELVGHSAGEVKCRKAKAVGAPLPYLRYRLDSGQLRALMALHARVGGGAEVCYAAAGFISRRELHRRQASSEVMEGSNFLSMRKIEETRRSYGLPPLSRRERHTWTYREMRMDGVLCSEPTPIEGVGRDDLMLDLLRRARANELGVAGHLDSLGGAVATWDLEQKRGVKKELPGYVEPQLALEPPPRALPEGVDQLIDRGGRQRQRGIAEPVRTALDVYDAARSRGIDWHLALVWPRQSTPG